ncbi:MAG: ribosome small subunit-dependent GTPase A [Actinomycetales bacterium]|nr:ribosome small subunit-dependent GTPase A [Actinomycetales bacterium]
MNVRRLTARSPDEDDIRQRRQPASRARTKNRPAHLNARSAIVTAVDRGRFTLILDPPEGSPAGSGDTGDAGSPPGWDGTPGHAPTPERLLAVKARGLGRRAVVVGDRVACIGSGAGADDMARIVRVADRAHVLRRSADDTDPVERVLVANADQLGIVIATTQPAPQPRLTDRALVAAWDAGMAPLLIVTKADLADPTPIRTAYHDLARTIVLSGRDSDVEPLRDALAHRTTVLLGSSGVGKSTLVNRLIPGADRRTGVVNDTTGRGRHTSSSAIALPLPGGGWLIDTPGVRSFGLAHVRPEDLIGGFTDLAPLTAGCPRGCRHLDDDCALAQADPDRMRSLRRLLTSLTSLTDTSAASASVSDAGAANPGEPPS